MWVLFLAVASFLAFVSIVLLLWLADVLETRKPRPERKVHLEPPFPALSIAQAFEPVFAPLWEAPVQALELVQSGGAHGIAVSRLRPTFNKATARFRKFTTAMVLNNGFGFSKTSSSSPGAGRRSRSLEKAASSWSIDSRPRPWPKLEGGTRGSSHSCRVGRQPGPGTDNFVELSADIFRTR